MFSGIKLMFFFSENPSTLLIPPGQHVKVIQPCTPPVFVVYVKQVSPNLLMYVVIMQVKF